MDRPARRVASRPDPLTSAQRSLNMSRIRARDTRPEMLLRREMHRQGMRYRLHERRLPGTPDVVLRASRTAIFVHGCFWHGHDCPKGVIPATRPEFWRAKLDRNRERDAEHVASLLDLGWRVAVVWECALVGRARLDAHDVAGTVRLWSRGGGDRLEIEGRWDAGTDRSDAFGAAGVEAGPPA